MGHVELQALTLPSAGATPSSAIAGSTSHLFVATVATVAYVRLQRRLGPHSVGGWGRPEYHPERLVLL